MNDEQLDEEILDLILQKRKVEQGYTLLLKHYQEKLYWQIRRMVTHHQDAHDVLQNTLIKIYKNLSKFKRESKLHTWMYRIASNESITFLREKKRRQSYNINDAANDIANKLEADSFFEGSKAVKQLYLAMDKLPDKQKQVFQLKYFDDMKYDQMSEVLGTSVGALKASYHHATKKIEKHFLEMKI